MAFKVGQRVRIIASNEPRPSELFRAVAAPETVGKEATIVAAGPHGRGYDWTLYVDGCGTRRLLVNNNEIAPLTDPAADAFIERIKKLKPYDEPTVAPQRVPMAEFNSHTIYCTERGVFMLGPDGTWQPIKP